MEEDCYEKKHEIFFHDMSRAVFFQVRYTQVLTLVHCSIQDNCMLDDMKALLSDLDQCSR